MLEELQAGIQAAQAEADEKRRMGDPRQSYEATAKVGRAGWAGGVASAAPVWRWVAQVAPRGVLGRIIPLTPRCVLPPVAAAGC